MGKADDAFICLLNAREVKGGCQGGRSNWVAEKAEACAGSVPRKVGGVGTHSDCSFQKGWTWLYHQYRLIPRNAKIESQLNSLTAMDAH